METKTDERQVPGERAICIKLKGRANEVAGEIQNEVLQEACIVTDVFFVLMWVPGHNNGEIGVVECTEIVSVFLFTSSSLHPPILMRNFAAGAPSPSSTSIDTLA